MWKSCEAMYYASKTTNPYLYLLHDLFAGSSVMVFGRILFKGLPRCTSSEMKWIINRYQIKGWDSSPRPFVGTISTGLVVMITKDYT